MCSSVIVRVLCTESLIQIVMLYPYHVSQVVCIKFAKQEELSLSYSLIIYCMVKIEVL